MLQAFVYNFVDLKFTKPQCAKLFTISISFFSALEDRYSVAAETRNNLVAASQNIQGAQRYLSNIQFPYCAPSEVETLNKATAYIFTDMQTKERHGHAMECYFVTSRRCGALLQWITQVSLDFKDHIITTSIRSLVNLWGGCEKFESDRYWKHSCNLSTLLIDSLSRALISSI